MIDRGADLGPLDRPYAPTTPPTPQTAGTDQDFRLVVALPLYGTNNAISSTADATTGRQQLPDGHVTPDVLLRWVHQFSFVKLSASVDASVDRYFIHSDQDSDSLYATFKAAWTDGSSDLFVPYLAYNGTLDFGPGLAEWNDTLYSFLLGFSSGIGFDAGGRLIPFRDAVNSGDWSISLDAAIGKRLANPTAFANQYAIASVDVVYNVSPTLRFGVTPSVRWRYYNDYFGAPRRDFRFVGYARAEWNPDWLTRLNPGAELQFGVSFLRNQSSLASANYSQWEGGPQLSLSWRF